MLVPSVKSGLEVTELWASLNLKLWAHFRAAEVSVYAQVTRKILNTFEKSIIQTTNVLMIHNL